MLCPHGPPSCTIYPCPYVPHAAHPPLRAQTPRAPTDTLTPALHENTHPPCTHSPCVWHWAEGSPMGCMGPTGGSPLSTPVPHQFHQHRLRTKKSVSSYNICCVCLLVMVAVGCVTAVLLSCLTYLVIIPLWSVAIVLMCTIMMTLFAIICLSLIEPWIPYAPQAQHAPWCQVRLQGMEHLTSLGGGCRTWLGPKPRSGGQPHVSMLCMSWSHHAWHTRAWGGSIAAHTPLPVPEALVTPSSTDLPPSAPSPQPHHHAQAHPMWGQDNSVAPSCCGAGCHHPRAAPQWHVRLSPLQPTALSPPCASRTGRACDLLAPTCPGTWRR
ncbi:uncharacterized protein LOC134517237 [Chroicocephalus ridibundus]|uniref:uncharacterized protein LOC134517237 n=1 Tax=Chroicocephalus ridibundus TaxID=1192867 RepID=UPI002FDE4AB8